MLAEGFHLDIHDAAAEGRADDPARPGRPPRRVDVHPLRSGDKPRGGASGRYRCSRRAKGSRPGLRRKTRSTPTAIFRITSKQAQPGRWIAFRAVNADGSTDECIAAVRRRSRSHVEKGTPSAEGPLTTAASAVVPVQDLRAVQIQPRLLRLGKQQELLAL